MALKEAPKNKIESLIPGAVINLKASPGEEFSIKITEDSKKITEKISSQSKHQWSTWFHKEQNQMSQPIQVEPWVEILSTVTRIKNKSSNIHFYRYK